MKLATMIKYDITLQFRHGFYHAYLLITALFILFIQYLPLGVRPVALTMVIFSDPAMFGFFFIGALVLLERDQKILENLFITPLKLREYLISKFISLSLLVLSVSLLISLFSLGLSFNPFWLLLGVLLSAGFFILTGLAVASQNKTFNDYILTGILYEFALSIPLLDYFGVWKSPIFYLFPTKASLIMIGAAFNPTSVGLLIYALINLLLWIVLAYFWARSCFYHYVIFRTEGKT